MVMKNTFSVTKIQAKTSGILKVVPVYSPYFLPKRIQFRSFDCAGQTFENLNFKIGAVSVGGSPQLSINVLIPNDDSFGISSKDLSDGVNWAIFSTKGLARELEISVYNPHETDLLIYTHIEGEEIDSLNTYSEDKTVVAAIEVYCSYCGAPAGKACISGSKFTKSVGKRLRKPHRARVKAAGHESVQTEVVADSVIPQVPPGHGVGYPMSSETVEINPRGTRMMRISPQVAPYIKPFRSRVHASIGQIQVPLVVADIIFGKSAMFGGAFQILEDIHRYDSSQPQLDDSPHNALRRLRRYIDIMQVSGMDGVKRYKENMINGAPVPQINGIPSDLLESADGWHDISSMPIFSTTGLGTKFYYLLYNPWPHRVRASVTLCGDELSSLDEE